MSFVRIESFGFVRVADMLQAAPQIAREELLAAMTESDLFLQGEVVERTPTAHGTLRSSVFTEERVNGDSVLGVVGSPLSYATYVELGTRPHFPPIEPLIDWVKTKLGVVDKEARGVAFLIARAIAARGTLAVGMFNRAFAYARPQIDRRFDQAFERITQRMGQIGTQGGN